jgi:hypothetical protein
MAAQTVIHSTRQSKSHTQNEPKPKTTVMDSYTFLQKSRPFMRWLSKKLRVRPDFFGLSAIGRFRKLQRSKLSKIRASIQQQSGSASGPEDMLVSWG